MGILSPNRSAAVSFHAELRREQNYNTDDSLCEDTPFNYADPQFWFFMVEAKFELVVSTPITASKTKFNFCVTHIPPEAESTLRDIIINPDEEDPYQLKAEILDPLNKFLEGHKNKNKSPRPSKKPENPLQWSDEADKAFILAKQALANATLLKYSIPVSIMKKLNPRNPILHGNSKFFVNPSLTSCSHIFLRNDRVRPPLTSPYSGPHLVKSRTDENFVIDLNGKNVTVTIDRCKHAYEISETPPKIAFPNGNLQNDNSKNRKITRYGRVVRFPKRLSEEI
ncbi:hypothetical protein HNY73_011475 [Argiope bruennichi]|uniref:DUF7041 domain-containing protein n=1 Tax=Argiope bruennichi TaxID=94029 RepID=A0A8T0F6X4_ARGBR|nr:hypothetical protein HNY73_011475 [Argiope bruennichi]